MNKPWLVFLHGINAGLEDRWRESLVYSLSQLGYEHLDESRVITPDYREILRGDLAGSEVVEDTWERPSKTELREAKTRYLARTGYLESRLRPLANAAPDRVRPPEFDGLPPSIPLLEQARRYAAKPAVRSAVRSVVVQSLEAVPEGSQLVIIGHSLGSVVAVDVIKAIPPSLYVNTLVTIGSPLGAVSKLRSRVLDDYPYDRLGAWVNVFEPRDPVTGGRGVAEHYRETIDIPIVLEDWVFPEVIHQHGAEYYCLHKAVATAVGEGLVGSELVTVRSDQAVGVEGLELALLQSLYLRELAKQLPPTDSVRLTKFERARQSIAQDHASAAVLIHQRNPGTATLPASEFMNRPDVHIRGAWDDTTVLPLAIMLASGAPASPFEVETDPRTDERRSALISTLSLIREDASQATDRVIAEAVLDARSEISSYLAAGRSWLPAALVAGAVVMLAATGIGVAAAAPVGVAGAALITSTLAAFGPGGMIGGMATLVALAGASSAALTAAGTSLRNGDDSRGAPDLLTTALDEALASGDVETLRSLLGSVLTLVAAQEKLGYASQRSPVIRACQKVRGQLSTRLRLHESIAPKSRVTKATKEMLEIIDKAVRWLHGEHKPESQQALDWRATCTAYELAFDGKPEEFEELLAAPSPRDGGPPALPGISQ